MDGAEVVVVVVGILAANTPFYVMVAKHEGKLVSIQAKLDLLVELVKDGGSSDKRKRR